MQDLTPLVQALRSRRRTAIPTAKCLYDPSGNVDCVTASGWAGAACPGSGSASLLVDYGYDHKNRLSAYRQYSSGSLTDTADYAYDALDRTVTETETHPGESKTTSFVYVGASNAVGAETITGTGATTKKYAYDARSRRMTLTDGTNRYSYVIDPPGSVSLLLDQNRTVKASYGYTAYGAKNPIADEDAPGTRLSIAPCFRALAVALGRTLSAA